MSTRGVRCTNTFYVLTYYFLHIYINEKKKIKKNKRRSRESERERQKSLSFLCSLRVGEKNKKIKNNTFLEMYERTARVYYQIVDIYRRGNKNIRVVYYMITL